MRTVEVGKGIHEFIDMGQMVGDDRDSPSRLLEAVHQCKELRARNRRRRLLWHRANDCSADDTGIRHTGVRSGVESDYRPRNRSEASV